MIGIDFRTKNATIQGKTVQSWGLRLSARFVKGQKWRMENQSGRFLPVKLGPRTDIWQEMRRNGVLIGLTATKRPKLATSPAISRAGYFLYGQL